VNGVPDQFADLLFPMKGLDISVEFELQPPGTTDAGTNVRAFEPLTGRARGGSRPGQAKYVTPQLPTGAEVVQLLDTIVDPTVDALLTSFDDPGFNGDTVILDPSTNNFAPAGDPYGGGAGDPANPTGNPTGDGFTLARNPLRRIRDGGSGIPPNRHRAGTGTVSPPPPPPPTTIQFVQEKHENFGATAAGSLAFDADVAQGDLVAVVVAFWFEFVETGEGNFALIDFSRVSVTDADGTTYRLATTGQAEPGDNGSGDTVLTPQTDSRGVGIFYGVRAATAGPCTVSVDAGTQLNTVGGLSVAILEYSGVKHGAGFDSSVSLDGTGGDATGSIFDNLFSVSNESAQPINAGTPTVTGTGELLLAAVPLNRVSGQFAAGSGYTTRTNLTGTDNADLFVEERIGVSASESPGGTLLVLPGDWDDLMSSGGLLVPGASAAFFPQT
jgi:hypothetical protein